jgi:hypothetical protein
MYTGLADAIAIPVITRIAPTSPINFLFNFLFQLIFHHLRAMLSSRAKEVTRENEV